MEDNVNIKQSWCEGWARWSLIIAIYHTRRLSWCKRQLPMSSSHHLHKNHQEAEETEGITSIMVWERNAIYCSPTPIPEWAKKLKNWWRNKGKKRRNNVSAQMSFLGTQCWHSDILNSSTVSKAIRHVTIPSESLERGLSACQVSMWICSFPTEIFPPQSRCSSHRSLWSPYFLWIISPLLLIEKSSLIVSVSPEPSAYGPFLPDTCHVHLPLSFISLPWMRWIQYSICFPTFRWRPPAPWQLYPYFRVLLGRRTLSHSFPEESSSRELMVVLQRH